MKLQRIAAVAEPINQERLVGLPLAVNYRNWLQEGEMTVEQAQALWNNFAQPPKVTMK